MDLLVLADQTGIVDMTTEAIARRTNVPIELIDNAMVGFTLPRTHIPGTMRTKVGGLFPSTRIGVGAGKL